MKKIAFIIGGMSNGGAERVISIISNYLSSQYQIHIIPIMYDELTYKLNENIIYSPLIVEKTNSRILRNYYRIRNLRRFIKSNDFDLVISFLAMINIYTILACLFTNRRIILCERNDPKTEPHRWELRLVRDISYHLRRRNYFVFQTDYAQQCFSNIIQRKSTIIYNPLKPNMPYIERDKIEKKIVTVARLHVNKNLSMLLQAFSAIHEEYADYTLEIYGEGPLKSNLMKECKKLKIENNVKFMGYCLNVHEKIKNAMMFVLPSNYEGISNAMIEALSMGIPTICTDCPAYGARIFIKDGINGFLIPVGDEEALICKMKELILNNNLREKLSFNSIKIRKILDEEIILKEWCNIIQRIIN